MDISFIIQYKYFFLEILTHVFPQVSLWNQDGCLWHVCECLPSGGNRCNREGSCVALYSLACVLACGSEGGKIETNTSVYNLSNSISVFEYVQWKMAVYISTDTTNFMFENQYYTASKFYMHIPGHSRFLISRIIPDFLWIFLILKMDFYRFLGTQHPIKNL